MTVDRSEVESRCVQFGAKLAKLPPRLRRTLRCHGRIMAKPSCPECDKVFTMKKNMYAHLRNVHKLDPDLSLGKLSRFLCNICGQPFGSKSGFSKHMRSKHDIKSYLKSSRIICPHEGCTERFKYYDLMRKHLHSCHHVETDLEELRFKNLTEFEVWKRDMERETTSVYALDTAETLKDGTVKKFWRCHRSYMYKPKGNGFRSLKAIGSNRIGKACPARIEVLHQNDVECEISVKFWKTHWGHSFDIDRMPLAKQYKDEIARQLREGVSFNLILDKIRDEYSVDSLDRICLVDRKDLHNIIQSYKINYCTKHLEYHINNLEPWVSNMQSLGEDNPFLYYKAQGVEKNDGFNKSDCVLIIMTRFQEETLSAFGSNKICIDCNCGTSVCDINLFTLIVVDDLEQGYPVAFCLTNRSDEMVFTLFFNKIKSKVGNIDTKIFMSDDCPSIYAAWKFVMSDVPQKLISTWDVDKSWRNFLVKIEDSKGRALVYKTLKVVHQSSSLDEFEENLCILMSHLESSEGMKEFSEYFKIHYAKRPQSWAYYFRKELGIKTFKFLDSLHKKLKYIYLDGGRKTKCLEKTVSALLKFTRDFFHKELKRLPSMFLTENRNNFDFVHLNNTVTPDAIKVLEPGKEWVVVSESETEFQVSKTEGVCQENCLRCHHCSVCIHNYKCSCLENLIKLNICKHIHDVHKIFFQRKRVEDLVNVSSDNLEINRLCEMEDDSVSYGNEKIE